MKKKKKYKGMVRYAKEGAECIICKTWLKVGERKANQFLCCNDKDARFLTDCQKKHYKNKRDKVTSEAPAPEYGFVFCDVCGTKVKKRDPMQKRCVTPTKGVLSVCQKKAVKKTAARHYENPPEPATAEAKRLCLRCGEKFESLHRFNRLCDKCTVLNERTAMPAHKILSEGETYAGSQLDLVEITRV